MADHEEKEGGMGCCGEVGCVFDVHDVDISKIVRLINSLVVWTTRSHKFRRPSDMSE